MTMVEALIINHGPLFYPTRTIKANGEFFCVGRSGFGISHPGNQQVRQIIKTRKSEYKALKCSEHGQFVCDLLNGELHNIKFVIPRAHLISKMQADDKATNTTTSSKEGVTSATTNSDATHCCVGDARREGLLETHESMEKIKSYPSNKDNNVCIVVGNNWTFDIVSHLLWDDKLCALPKTQIFETATRPSTPTLASKKRKCQNLEDLEGYKRVLPRYNGQHLNCQESVGSLFGLLFPEEAGAA